MIIPYRLVSDTCVFANIQDNNFETAVVEVCVQTPANALGTFNDSPRSLEKNPKGHNLIFTSARF